MNKYVIISDSSCDLSKEYRDKHQIEYAKMMLSWTDKAGKIHEGFMDLDWGQFTPKEFYNMIRNGTRFSTAQVTMQSYLELFEPHLQKGEDILYLACSSGLSASLRIAEMLNETELKEKYPNNRLIVLDTMRAGMSQGMIVQLAVELKDAGKSIDEVVEIIEKEKLKYVEIGIPESLSYLKRAGRVSAPAAYFGNIISLKPILVFDEKGSNKAIEKAIGRKKAYNRMAEIIQESIDDPENQVIYLMSADCSEEDIEMFKKAITSRIKIKEIVVQTLGPVIGATSGPGTIIVNYKCK